MLKNLKKLNVFMTVFCSVARLCVINALTVIYLTRQINLKILVMGEKQDENSERINTRSSSSVISLAPLAT